MKREEVRWTEWVSAAGGLLLAVSVFVKCYEARPENPNANIDGMTGTVSIWEAHDVLRWLLLLNAIAPIVLLWIIARGHTLSWPRGEMTMVIGLVAATVVFYIGVIDRPGEPSGEIELEIGWYGALLGALMMTVGATIRSSEVERKRKPPGVL